MIEIRLPREGSTTMASGVVLEWLVDVGDVVDAGQVLVEIETDKVSFEVVAPAPGTIRQRCAEVGEEVEVGAVLLRIGDPDEPLQLGVEEGTSASPAGTDQMRAGPTPSGRGGVDDPRRSGDPTPILRPASAEGPARAAPAARSLARQQGIDLRTVVGTGPLGRVTSDDVRAAAAAVPANATVPTADPLSGLTGHRAIVARRMSQASHETAAVTLMLRADVTRIHRMEGVSLIDVLSHEAARCVARHPELNATLTPQGILQHQQVGLGYAVDGARGLIVPVVRAAEALPLAEFAVTRRRVVRAALDATLAPADLDGGTFTVSNLGGTGVEFFTPIITPGQTAILGVGALTPTVVVTHGGTGFGARSLIGLSLTFDHRLVDGAEAGRYLEDLRAVLQDWDPTT